MAWQDNRLVFATTVGTELDAANVRRGFRAIVKASGIGGSWTPRELRHSFVSLMSEKGVPPKLSPAWWDTAAPPGPRSSTGMSSGRSSPREPRSWGICSGSEGALLHALTWKACQSRPSRSFAA